MSLWLWLFDGLLAVQSWGWPPVVIPLVGSVMGTPALQATANDRVCRHCSKRGSEGAKVLDDHSRWIYRLWRGETTTKTSRTARPLVLRERFVGNWFHSCSWEINFADPAQGNKSSSLYLLRFPQPKLNFFPLRLFKVYHF